MSRRRVAVTGIGMVSPVGTSAAECWDASLAGRAAVAPIPEQWLRWSGFQSTVWAPLPIVDFAAAGITPLDAMRLDTSAMLAIVAAGEALADAGLEASLADAKRGIWRLAGIDGDRAGVFMGTAVGGITTLIASQNSHLLTPIQPLERRGEANAPDPATDALDALLASLATRFNPFAASMSMPNAVSATLGIRYSLRGPNTTCALACAAGTAAVGHALRSIRGGDTDMVLCGGAEFVGDPFGGVFRGFDAARTLASVVDRPDAANRPFDRNRTGFLLAEGGAAVLVCEEWQHARRRGARIYAELVGYGESFDAYSMMIMEPAGQQLSRAVGSSLADAGIDPGDVDYVNAHGTGTVVNDDVESAVIETLFGSRPLVNATKSLTGHCIGASGAIEAAITALSLRDQKVHGCVNLEDPVRPLNFVRRSTDARLVWAVSQSSAFGGHNAAIVMRQAEP
ncbi:MAG: beta-ketoacyl-[acyl-carrier-protein] synthase family protein [Planctomycetota bacterium]